MASGVIHRVLPMSEKQVVYGSVTQFAMAGLSYLGAFCFNHEHANFAVAGVSDTAGSLATIFLPERQGWLGSRAVGATLYFTAAANALMSAWSL